MSVTFVSLPCKPEIRILATFDELRADTLERKKRLGRKASYRALARMTGYSHGIVHKILTGAATLVELPRDEILAATRKAIARLEDDLYVETPDGNRISQV